MQKPQRITLKMFFAALLISLSATAIIYLFIQSELYTGLNNDIYDRIFQTHSRPDATDDVIIVAIDDNSINKMMEVSNWPWPRNLYAEFNNYLIKCGVKGIAWDFIFTTPSSGANAEYSQRYDQAFNRSLQQGKVILGYDMTLHPIPNQSVKTGTVYQFPADHITSRENLLFVPWLTPIYPLLDPPETPGFIFNPPDNDGVVRKYIPFISADSADRHIHYSIAAAMANLAAPDIPGRVKLDNHGKMLLNWYGSGGQNPDEEEGVFTYYSAWDLYRSAFIASRYPSMGDKAPIKPADLKDKFIFVGSTVTAHGDVRVTPYSKGYVPYPGVEIHATAFLNMLHGDWLNPVPVWPQLLITAIAAFGIALVGINAFSKFRYSFLVIFLTLGGVAFEIYLFYSMQWKLELAAMFLLLVISYIFTLFANYVMVGRNRTIIKNALEQYLSPSLLKKVMLSGMNNIGGEEIVASVMFLDIADFSTFSEKHNPMVVVQTLNIYLQDFTEIIIRNGGYVNKFCGDGLLALFGSPEQENHHADWVLKTAIDCYYRSKELEGRYGLKIRIGVNSGPLIHGNIGGTRKLEFTAIGDTVNSASRMESLNKYLGTNIVVGGPCWSLSDESYPFLYVGDFILKGKEQPVKLYCFSMMDKKTEELFSQLLKAFQAKDRDTFRTILTQCDESKIQCKLIDCYRDWAKNQLKGDFGLPVQLLIK